MNSSIVLVSCKIYIIAAQLLYTLIHELHIIWYFCVMGWHNVYNMLAYLEIRMQYCGNVSCALLSPSYLEKYIWIYCAINKNAAQSPDDSHPIQPLKIR